MACTGQSAKLQGDMPECEEDVTLRLHLDAYPFTDQELLCYTCSHCVHEEVRQRVLQKLTMLLQERMQRLQS